MGMNGIHPDRMVRFEVTLMNICEWADLFSVAFSDTLNWLVIKKHLYCRLLFD